MQKHYALSATASRQSRSSSRQLRRPSWLAHLNVTLSIASLSFFPLFGPLDFFLGPVARSWTGSELSPALVWSVLSVAPFVAPVWLWWTRRLLPARISPDRGSRYAVGHVLVAATNTLLIGAVVVPYTLATLSGHGASANLAWFGVLAVPIGFALSLVGLVSVYTSAGRGSADRKIDQRGA